MNRLRLLMPVMILGILSISSWQVWNPAKGLDVHYGDQNSSVCFTGKDEDYDGHCVENGRGTQAYYRKLQLENAAKNQL